VAESKGSEKDEKTISSTIFAKSKNLKPGIYVNKAYKMDSRLWNFYKANIVR
jgi:hypothetical protein